MHKAEEVMVVIPIISTTNTANIIIRTITSTTEHKHPVATTNTSRHHRNTILHNMVVVIRVKVKVKDKDKDNVKAKAKDILNMMLRWLLWQKVQTTLLPSLTR